MAATLAHRGPDSEGTFVDGGAGLAARRLAIIDLDSGDQPISNEDGTATVVQNGEIYNYRELTRELERAGHRFATRSDTEVLVHAYEEWGLGFAERLRGMFAVAIWDATRRRLVLARDRFGIKPLYYRRRRRLARVRLGARRAAPRRGRPRRARGVPRLQLDPGAALDLPRDPQAAGRAHPHVGRRPRRAASATRGPARCPRGTTPTRPSSSRSAGRGCATRFARTSSPTCRSACCSRAASTRARSPRSRPRRAPSRCARSRSASRRRRSTSCRARARSRTRYGTRHRELVLRPDAALLLPALAEAFDEPFADSSALPTYLVSKLAAEDVKVALSGEGGDELFGGYYTYVADLHGRARRAAGDARAAGGRTAPDVDAPGELRLQGEALRRARRTCRRSSGTTAGRRSSRPTPAPS